MTAVKTWAMWCDHEGCKGSDAYNLGRGFATLGPLRRMAKFDGWVRREGKDFCPAHAAPSTPAAQETPDA